MPKINYKLSDRVKFDMLFDLLNPNFNESGNWTIDYSISDIYDDYAVAYSYENQGYERVYYTKDDKNDSLTINQKKKCYIVDVTEEERNALNTIQALNGGTYEKINENFTVNSAVEEKISEYEQKIEEKDTSISTLVTERDEAQTNYENAKNDIERLQTEIQEYTEYKSNVEKEKKQEVINKYSEQLEEEIISEYTNKIDEYTIENLEKELAFELVQSNPSIFSFKEEPMIPIDEPKTGIEAILEKYKK